VARIEELEIAGENQFQTIGQNGVPAEADMLETIFSQLVCFCFGKDEIQIYTKRRQHNSRPWDWPSSLVGHDSVNDTAALRTFCILCMSVAGC